MRNTSICRRSRAAIQAIGSAAVLCMGLCVGLLAAGSAHANPLKLLHEAVLSKARSDAVQAKTAREALDAGELEVAALNSLGRSAEALQRLDAAESAAPSAKRSAEMRAKVLLPLGRCDEAVPLLQADIAAKDAAAQSVVGAEHKPDGYLMMGAEPLLALTFCHAANKRFDAAAAALSRVLDPFDPSLAHYTTAWYAALRKLGAAPNDRLEALSKGLPAKAGTHAFSLAVAQGRLDPAQALRELQRLRLPDVDAQDASAELLFFAAVAADSEQARADLLARLDALAPFGSAEWVMAKRLFPSR